MSSKISALTTSTVGASDFVPIQRGGSNFNLNLKSSIQTVVDTYKVFYAPAPSGGDDKTALQAVIDAAIAAGGGIVQLAAGVYNVHPLATGIGLLTDGDYVILRGVGEGTEINFLTSTASANFCGIAPYRYNTCTAPYTAAPLYIEDLRLTSDDYTSITGHDLIGICHCPWAIVRRVGFEQIKFHAFEINVSKNVLVEDCYTYGTGNIGGVLIELDGLGGAGQIATGGTHSASTPIENIIIRRFIQRVPRTDLTISTSGYDSILLSHTNTNNVLRNIVIEGCSFIPHNNSSLAAGITSSVVGFDSGALPLTVDGLTIRNNVWASSGGLSGSHILLDLSAASTSTRNIRNVRIENNQFYSPHGYAIKIGAGSSTSSPRTSITDALLRSHDTILMENNTISVYLNGNSNSARAVRSVWVGAARSVIVRNNTIEWPDVANGSGWGTSTVSTGIGFWIDHVQNLILENNTVQITRPQTGGTAGLWCQVYAFCFGVGSFEIQTALSGHWRVENNKAIGNGNIGVNLACGFLMTYGTGTTMSSWTTANKTNPRISGLWRGNSSVQTGTGTYTHTLQSTYPDYFLTAASITNTPQTEAQLATMGAHDWYPNSNDIGIVTTTFTGAVMGPGWKLYDGSATSALGWLQEANWNIRLGLSATTTLPTTADTYIRLSGN